MDTCLLQMHVKTNRSFTRSSIRANYSRDTNRDALTSKPYAGNSICLMDKYDILRMAGQARRDPLLKGYPEFFSPDIQVNISKCKGRCLIALCELKEGDLIIASKAISASFSKSVEFDEDPTPYLVMELANRIGRDNEAQEKVYGLVAGNNYESSQPPTDINIPRIAAICSHNSFSGESFDALFPNKSESLSGGSVSGLWVEPAYLNHSCAPNCAWFCVGDFLFMIAIRDIAKSEELVHSYADVMSTYKERLEYLRPYGFSCDCARCDYFKSNPEMVEIEENFNKKISEVLQTAWENAEHELEVTLALINSIKTEITSPAQKFTAILWIPLVTVVWLFYRLQKFDKCIAYGLEAGEIGSKWYGTGHPAVVRAYMPVIKGYVACNAPEQAKELTGHLLRAHILRFKTNKNHFFDSYRNLVTLLGLEQVFTLNET
eukprot:Phypoly_transcript_04166.p1 GENE.Phypoly_transcript_04166~~Phypoly_transcript_04166.p1  ORF type:complete len:433 (-),score=44.44 Phypoly_transcript_04166:148-1446(-)